MLDTILSPLDNLRFEGDDESYQMSSLTGLLLESRMSLIRPLFHGGVIEPSKEMVTAKTP